jgi:hypothetical protein
MFFSGGRSRRTDYEKRGMNKTELYKDFTISWQEPPQTSAKWTANVASEDRHLYELMGRHGAEVVDSSNRNEMLGNAKRYIDKLLGAL